MASNIIGADTSSVGDSFAAPVAGSRRIRRSGGSLITEEYSRSYRWVEVKRERIVADSTSDIESSDSDSSSSDSSSDSDTDSSSSSSSDSSLDSSLDSSSSSESSSDSESESSSGSDSNSDSDSESTEDKTKSDIITSALSKISSSANQHPGAASLKSLSDEESPSKSHDFETKFAKSVRMYDAAWELEELGQSQAAGIQFGKALQMINDALELSDDSKEAAMLKTLIQLKIEASNLYSQADEFYTRASMLLEQTSEPKQTHDFATPEHLFRNAKTRFVQAKDKFAEALEKTDYDQKFLDCFDKAQAGVERVEQKLAEIKNLLQMCEKKPAPEGPNQPDRHQVTPLNFHLV